MKRQNEEIDKLFSSGLSNYEEMPSANAWEQIEQQLPSKSYRTIYWVAASMVGILLTATIAWNNILKNSPLGLYDTQEREMAANYPQKEFIAVPILIQTKTIVYVHRDVPVKSEQAITQQKEPIAKVEPAGAALELQPLGNDYALQTTIPIPSKSSLLADNDELPVSITYKKGDPKYPKLLQALSFIKEVGEGQRHLIDIDKITNGLMARRETSNNSNN